MSVLAQDLRFALRSLRKRWMVTGLAVLSLALAIGGNAAVFSMVDAFIFRPLPYPDADRIVLVGERAEDQPEFSGQLTTSLATAADWSERSRTVERWGRLQPRTLSLRGSERSEPVSAVAVTPSVFEVLEARATRGRLFTEAEAVEGGPRVVVLGTEFWIDRWGEGVDPLGETLTLNGEPYQVIGVLPEGFGFLTPNQDLWIPIQESATGAARDLRNTLAFGKLQANASTEQARTELRSMFDELAAEHTETLRGWTVDVYNMRYDIPTQQSRILFGMLQGSVLLVLVIACVNITNLLLARGQERRREIALRTVLGAGRTRIVRQLLTESFVMVAAGALIGVGLAAFGIGAMARQFAGVLPAGFEIQMDVRVLLFTLGVSVVAGLLFGLAPALQTLRQSHSSALREGGGRGGSGRSRKLLTKTLVVGEIALSFLALGGGSLLVRSFLQIRSSDPGFDATPVLTAVMSFPASSYPEPEDRDLLHQQILERSAELPGVVAASLVNVLPQAPIATADSFRIDGAPVDAAVLPPRGVVVQASAEYLDVLDIDLLQGRFFGDGDRIGSAPTVVVNRTLAEAHFQGRSPLGERLTVRGESREIVGVVEDVQQVLFQTGGTQSGETVYLPARQETAGNGFLILRTNGDPRRTSAPLREALEAVDRDLTLSQVLTMEEYTDQFLVGINVFNVVLTVFGVIALLLASLGTYGVLAYSVSRRSHEIGIRMALGAESRQVVRMIAKQGFWMGAVGLVLGILMTVPLVGVMQNVLQGIASVQPSTLVLIAALLFGVTMAASLVPAGRASAVDPIRTLRDE